MSGAVAGRLEAARRACFVGRADELELFEAALHTDEPPFTLLLLHGSGGVGKTALLHRFRGLAERAGLPVVRVDGRDVQATPNGFRSALAEALDVPDPPGVPGDPPGVPGDPPGVPGDPAGVLGAAGRAVLLVDTYESLTPIDGWLRDEFLPRLPDRVLVVVAGRQPPAAAWRTDPGWRDLVRVIALSNLDAGEATGYLRTMGVPAWLHRDLVDVTHGHPLALALAIDVLRQGDAAAMLERMGAPDVVQALLQRFVDELPTVGHRHALQVCAEARTTTEAVLRAALDEEDVHARFEWLRRLSFVEHGPHGLFPHDLARDVLVADLKWRDPEVRATLHRRIRVHAMTRLRAARGRAQQLAALDFLFTEYSDPVFRQYWNQWDTMGQALGEPAQPSDRAEILAIVERHEGAASAALAAHWFDRQPGSFVVYRRGHAVMGVLVWLSLHDASPVDVAADPATRTALRYVVDTAAPAPGDEVTMARFIMDREHYQAASQIFNVGSVHHVLHVLCHPRLSWDLLVVADAEFWTPLWTHIGYDRAPDADFEVGGRRFAVFARDWRTAPLPTKWSDLLEDRAPRTPTAVTAAEPTGPPVPPEYVRNVRQALRDLRRPDLLARNPLLSSQLVRARAGERPAPAVLVELVHEAAAILRQHPRDEKLYRVLDRTYLRPAHTQELAAELLGLPSSTYRRHLATAIGRVVAWLWEREAEQTGR